MPQDLTLSVDLESAGFGAGAAERAIAAAPRGVTLTFEATPAAATLAWIEAEFDPAAGVDAARGALWVASDGSGRLGVACVDARGLAYFWLHAWRARRTVGMLGPVFVVARARGRGIGRALANAASATLRERGYARGLVAAVDAATAAWYERAIDAFHVANVDRSRAGRRLRATILASGNGGTFAHVASAAAAGALPLDVAALVCNRDGAPVLARGAAAGVPAHVAVWDRDAESRGAYDARVLAAVAATEPELVLLLGWMHVLPATFVARFPELANLHPAYLPLDASSDVVTAPDGTRFAAYRGAHAIDDALRAGSAWAGATVHRVGVAVDRGAVLARAPLALRPGEDRAALDARLHALERSVVDAAVARLVWERSES